MIIFSQDIGMEFGIEKCAMLVMKSSKQRKQSNYQNQVGINARKKGNLQILAYFEAVTKEVEMKEKLKKSISGEPESYSKQSYIEEILSKG